MRHFLFSLLTVTGCRDVAHFSTSASEHYEGAVVSGSFVRAGVGDDVKLCVTLDADHLQDAPGAVSSSDGRFKATPLRPIPQLWHDPMSTLTFGQGRVKNLLYVATPASDAGAIDPDVMVVLSLMQSGALEARVFRGAPAMSGAPPPAAPNLFAVFALNREPGGCPF